MLSALDPAGGATLAESIFALQAEMDGLLKRAREERHAVARSEAALADATAERARLATAVRAAREETGGLQQDCAGLGDAIRMLEERRDQRAAAVARLQVTPAPGLGAHDCDGAS
jgi:predicted  nucleic acid-binding Zn-ribbon protein